MFRIRVIFLNLILAALVYSGVASAGTAVLTGFGEVKAKGEFVTFTVQVKSECFASATLASRSNDAVANQIIKILEEYITAGSNDEITATGGFVSRQINEYGNREKTRCVHKFKKENLIVLKSEKVEAFASIFSVIQDRLYALGMEFQADEGELPLSYLEIGTPQVDLSPTTLRTLEKKALEEAIVDAQNKFRISASTLKIGKYKVTGFTENSSSPRPTPEYLNASDVRAPIKFSALIVKKWISVTFEFEDSSL